MYLYVNSDNVTSFDNVGVEYIPKEIKKIIGNKNITANVYRRKENDSIMFWYFCIGLTDFMLKYKICYIIPIYFVLTNMQGMKK